MRSPALAVLRQATARRPASAKLVRATALGHATYPLARAAIAEVEARWAERLGARKLGELGGLLEELDSGRR